MLDQDTEEPFDRPEERPVDHDRAMPGQVAVLTIVDRVAPYAEQVVSALR